MNKTKRQKSAQFILFSYICFLFINVSSSQAEDYRREAHQKNVFSARPYYVMARVMTFVKDRTDSSNQKKCADEFQAFYTHLSTHGIWLESAESLKNYLHQLSKQKALEHYPTAEDLTFYLRYNFASWQESAHFINDPFLLIAAYRKNSSLTPIPPSPELFSKIDLTLSAYHAFLPFREMPKLYATSDRLISAVVRKDFFSLNQLREKTLAEIEDIYREYYPEHIDLSTLSPERQTLLAFEVALYAYISKKVLATRGIYPPSWQTQLSTLLPHLHETAQGDCPICLDPLVGSRARCSTCQHDTCLPCLQHYQETNPQGGCPFCRTPFGEKWINFRVTVIPLPHAFAPNPSPPTQFADGSD
jgi:hypothetical protein